MNIGSTGASPSTNMSSSPVQGAAGIGGAGEGQAEDIFNKLVRDVIENGKRTAAVKNIQALIRAGSGQ